MGMSSSDPIRFGETPMANVVRLANLRGTDLVCHGAVARLSQGGGCTLPGGKTLIQA